MTDECREGWVYKNRDGTTNAPHLTFYGTEQGENIGQFIPATLIIHHPAKEYVGNAGRVFKKNERGEVVTRARDDVPWKEVSVYVGSQEPANLRALADCMEDR